MFWAEIWQNIRIFVWKLSIFGGEIFNIFEQACFRYDRKTALERLVGKLLMSFNQFYARSTSPVIMMQLQVTNIWSVHIRGPLPHPWNITYNQKHCRETAQACSTTSGQRLHRLPMSNLFDARRKWVKKAYQITLLYTILIKVQIKEVHI